MNLTLKVWRQNSSKEAGQLVTYPVKDISPDMSFLEMFDVLNEQLVAKNENPIIFKKRLAFELVRMLNNESDAQTAQKYFEDTFQKKNVPECQ